ncbi:MAG: hypothetical protein M3R30_00610 [Candidatus Eremiobacteraeota bacterium]|nr:hypothetical protein [Candidatus Eremiobacteraeota bacterium]
MKQLLTRIALLSACIALGVTPLRAAQPPMPPGMTPALLKQMMTLGPAHPKGLPANVIPVSGCIPSMGYHYAAPGAAPFGPIYGTYNGKPVFTEIMIDQKMFANGKSWSEVLKPLPGYKIDHVDIWFEAHGHPGYPIPHYDIHAWYVPHAVHMLYCGNKDGKKPAFL